MSHIARIELEVTDLEALSKACQHLGLNLIQGQKSFQWYNGQAACDHAIKVPGAAYEIGLVLKEGKYDLQADFWDKGVEAVIGKSGGLLKQRYALERTKAEAARKGYRIIEKQTENGIRLHVRI